MAMMMGVARHVLDEAFRVGSKVIISYTNFAHWRIRLGLMFFGASPKPYSMQGEWHERPTHRFLSINDFHAFVEMLRIDDPLQRAFYEIECVKNAWSVRELKRQIGSLLFERLGLSTDKDHSLVEYALGGMDENLFVSAYKVALPSAEDLQRFLREQTAKF